MFYTCPNFKALDFLRSFSVDHFAYITCSESRNSGKSCNPQELLSKLDTELAFLYARIELNLKYTVALV